MLNIFDRQCFIGFLISPSSFKRTDFNLKHTGYLLAGLQTVVRSFIFNRIEPIYGFELINILIANFILQCSECSVMIHNSINLVRMIELSRDKKSTL